MKEEIKQIVYESCPYDHRCEKTFTLWSELVESGEGKVRIVPCPCAEKVERFYRYRKAGIDRSQWDFDFDKIDDNFDRKILTEYVSVFREKAEECIKNKLCMWFYGTPGSGTTSIAILVLKHMLDLGFKGRFMSANDIIYILYNKDISELLDYEFLVVDSVDSLRDGVVKDFASLMCEFMEKKSIIFTSGRRAHDLNRNYPEDFKNRVENIPNVRFKDINFRELKSKFLKIKNS